MGEIIVKIIVRHIVSALKSLWFNIKMKALNIKLKLAKKEAKDAKETSDNMVDDFRSEYKQYLWNVPNKGNSKNLQSDDSSGVEVRSTVKQVREDSGQSGDND